MVVWQETGQDFFCRTDKSIETNSSQASRSGFANGDVRQILRQEQAKEYLNVFIEGPPLKPSDIGFPETIRIVE